MQLFLLPRLIASNRCITTRKTQLGFLIQNAFLDFCSFTSVSEGHSFTVSYLINSCGLSPKTAIQASKYLRLENYEQPNSVVSFLKDYGFSDTQVTKIVKHLPRILSTNPTARILPKLKFLQSIGISGTDLTEFLVSNPRVLGRSIDEYLLPRYEILKRVLSNDEDVIKSLKCGVWSLGNVGDYIIPNIRLLRELGVAESSISLMVRYFPDVAFMKHTEFFEAVKSAKGMGLDPRRSLFVFSVQVLAKTKPYKWKSRLETYERWGWSKSVVLSAFKRHPNCMLISEEKINKTMNFLVNQMGYAPEDIAAVPSILPLSLEKRIIPRCLVVQTLKSKGLVKNDLGLRFFLLKTEKNFKCYVARFQDHDKGKMGPSGVIQS